MERIIANCILTCKSGSDTVFYYLVTYIIIPIICIGLIALFPLGLALICSKEDKYITVGTILAAFGAFPFAGFIVILLYYIKICMEIIYKWAKEKSQEPVATKGVIMSAPIINNQPHKELFTTSDTINNIVKVTSMSKDAKGADSDRGGEVKVSMYEAV